MNDNIWDEGWCSIYSSLLLELNEGDEEQIEKKKRLDKENYNNVESDLTCLMFNEI